MFNVCLTILRKLDDKGLKLILPGSVSSDDTNLDKIIKGNI